METSFPTRIGKEPCNNGLIIHGDAARVRYSLVLPSERSTGREGTCTWRVLENASVASLPGRGRCYFVTNSALLFRTVPLDVSPHFHVSTAMLQRVSQSLRGLCIVSLRVSDNVDILVPLSPCIGSSLHAFPRLTFAFAGEARAGYRLRHEIDRRAGHFPSPPWID